MTTLCVHCNDALPRNSQRRSGGWKRGDMRGKEVFVRWMLLMAWIVFWPLTDKYLFKTPDWLCLPLVFGLLYLFITFAMSGFKWAQQGVKK